MNSVYLIGHSGANADLKQTTGGTSVLNVSLATSEKRGDAYETHWHRIVMFGKTAEMMANRIFKGTQLFVQGKLFTRTWDDKSGQKKTSVEVVANWVRVIQKDAPNDGGRYGGQEAGNFQPGPGPMMPNLTEEDIPF